MSSIAYGADDLSLVLFRNLDRVVDRPPQRSAAELLDATGKAIAKFFSGEPGWLQEFERAVHDAQSRENHLDVFWRDLSLWVLSGHQYDAEECASLKADNLHAVRWAIQMHNMGSDKLSVEECAKLAMHAQSCGAAGIYLMNAGCAAVATAYSSLAALRDLNYVERTLSYASTAMFARTWHGSDQKPFWPLVAAKALELVKA